MWITASVAEVHHVAPKVPQGLKPICFLPLTQARKGLLHSIARFCDLSLTYSSLPSIMDKINVVEKFSRIHEYWKPYIAAELNGQYVKLDKLKGEFVFHHHKNEDEMFLVVKGRFRMEFSDRQVWLEEGKFII